MSSKKIIFSAIACVILIGVIWYASQHFIQVNHHWIYVERADTVATQEEGLGGRDSLCADCGMLFDFAKPYRYAFWMKGMRFSLDIVWIADSRVVYIQKNIPAGSKDIFTPPVEANQILEINAGKADEWGLEIGTEFLPLIR
ncbi:MAG: DUF192 domain-containing protein [Candidatus Moraniibacteriota bacterium]